MNNKWLLVSSVSTVLGIAAGAVYLLFAEHSLLLSNNNWVLSAFWSAFMLWAFVLMFIAALVFNVMAFFELDEQHKMLGLTWPLRRFLSTVNKPQQFMQHAEDFLLQQGKLTACAKVSAAYKCLQGSGAEKLVYFQHQEQLVDINHIRALFQQMLAADIRMGIAVSYFGFSNQARIFAHEANIELLDMKSLKKQQKQGKAQQFALV